MRWCGGALGTQPQAHQASRRCTAELCIQPPQWISACHLHVRVRCLLHVLIYCVCSGGGDTCACHGTGVKVRGQLVGADSLLSP